MKPLGPFGFKGGWNTKESAWTLPKDSLTDSQNINIVHQDISKRGGNAILNSSVLAGGAGIHGLFDWLANSGSRYLIITAGLKVYQSLALSSTFNDITGAATVTGGANNQHTFASLNNIVAICGGTTPDTPLQWTGSGNVSSLAGSPPIGNIVTVANNFMFISGVTATPSRVFWSNVSDPNTWGAANFIDFRASDGDSVTALIELNQNLVIFKRRSIGLLFTQTNTVSGSVTLAPLTEVIVGIGCAGAQAVENLPDGTIVFLGINGHVYKLIGGTIIEDISDPPGGSNIQPTLDSMNATRLPYAVVKAYPQKNQVWISISSSTATTNDTILIYDYQLKIWVSKFININANVMEPTIDARTTPSHPIVMVTGDYLGQVYEQDKGMSDATVSGGVIDGYGTISIQVGIDKTDYVPRYAVIPLEGQSAGSITFAYGFNGITQTSTSTVLSEAIGGSLLGSTFVLGTSLLVGPGTLRLITPIVDSGRSYSIQMKFENSTSTQTFVIHPVYIGDEVIV